MCACWVDFCSINYWCFVYEKLPFWHDRQTNCHSVGGFKVVLENGRAGFLLKFQLSLTISLSYIHQCFTEWSLIILNFSLEAVDCLWIQGLFGLLENGFSWKIFCGGKRKWISIFLCLVWWNTMKLRRGKRRMRDRGKYTPWRKMFTRGGKTLLHLNFTL